MGEVTACIATSVADVQTVNPKIEMGKWLLPGACTVTLLDGYMHSCMCIWETLVGRTGRCAPLPAHTAVAHWHAP